MEQLSLPAFEPGWVWLVGADPGDPALLTVGALHAFRSADTVVHDALVNDQVLALASSDAELIYAGKRGGKPSPKQLDISARLIALAREGRKVLRLKSGDPFLFGRGGEETLALVGAEVPLAATVQPGYPRYHGGGRGARLLAYPDAPGHSDCCHLCNRPQSVRKCS